MCPPEDLLTGVYWSFAEPVPASPDALVAAAIAYAADIEAPSPERALRGRLPLADLLVRYSHWVRESGGEWQECEVDHRVVGTVGELTGAELLWEVHVACHSTVGQGDRHFFEGLHRLADIEGQAAYRVALGS